MTIRRIEYTSCEDGVEGIRGFQVRAISPQVPDALREAALRDSIYEPAPSLPSMPTSDELASFPVGFGFAEQPPGLVLYHSNYVGRDHTGRWGNYFAQALTLDQAHELDGLLPIDLWRSAIWRSSSTVAGELPLVPATELQASGGASAELTEQFLTDRQAHPALTEVLAAVRSIIDRDRGRLVFVVDSSHDAAFWLSAITRSFPRRMSLTLSFTTYTARPETHHARLACTTADVDVPPYGDYRVVHLDGDAARTARDADDEFADFERVLPQIWAHRGAPHHLMEAADEVDPPLRVGELNAFVRQAMLFENYPVSVDWTEGRVLEALDFAAARVPRTLSTPWDRALQTIEECGGPQQVERWSTVLRVAVERGAPVPGPLLRHYLQAAVKAMVSGAVTTPLWLPDVDAAAARQLSENLVVPALLGDPPAGLLTWLADPTRREVREQALDLLTARLAPPRPMKSAVGTLTGRAPGFLAANAAGRPLLALYAQIAEVRDGRAGASTVLLRATPDLVPTRESWRQLTALLWPVAPPDPREALRLLDAVPLQTLLNAELPDQFVERLIEDAAEGSVSDDDVALAERLSQPEFIHVLGGNGPATIDAVRLVGYFATSPPGDKAVAEAAFSALNLGEAVSGPLADRLFATVASWLLSLHDQTAHRELLMDFAKGTRRFLPAYARTAATELEAASPTLAAQWIVTWRTMPSSQLGTRVSARMLEEVAPKVLSRSGRKHLDQIGEHLPLYVQPGRHAPNDWDSWWREWRGRFERQGLFSRLRSPKPGRGK